MRRRVFITIPAEDAEAKGDECGLLQKSLYGAQDASANWEAEYTDMVVKADYEPGVANVSLFYNEGQDSRTVDIGVAKIELWQ